ncbi:dehydrogenase/reductase SDR family [Salix suchowensis]|nr:dehydrogenase/reductase SDR family [Salix suchowensis]
MNSSPRSSLTGKVKRRPWWVKNLTGWSYVIYEMLFQRMQARHLKNPLPLPPLDDVTCIVTGSTSGIGLETARQLAFSGAHVVMAVRNQSAAFDLIKKWQTERHGTTLLSIEVMELNLLSLSSVVKFAKALNSRSKPLQVLINNAGMFSMGEPQKFSKDGYETHLQVNFLAPAMLSILLLPSLVKGSPSRIINVNSIMHYMGFVDTDDMNFTLGKEKFNSTKAYSSSKLAQIMFYSVLQKRLPLEAGISVLCISPGTVHTNVTRDLPKLVQGVYNLIPVFLFSAQEGSRSALYAATDPEIPEYCEELKADDWPTCAYISHYCRPTRAAKEAHNTRAANEVWEKTLDMTGLPLDAVEKLLQGEEAMCKYTDS